MIEKDLTIILLLYNTPRNLIKNLHVYKHFKILILDQSNDYNLKKKITKFLPNIEFYKVTNNNLGFAKGVNFLVKKVKTKYFLCTQVDVLVSNKTILSLKKTFLKKKDCIISIPSLKNKISKKKIFSVNSFIGAIFLANKKRFLELKGFDEDYFFYWEDIDFSYKIKGSNYKIYLSSISKATHLYGKSTSSTFTVYLLKNLNFRYGEYLFNYKNKKLKIIKLIRDPIFFIVKLIFSIILFNKLRLYKSIANLLGILKFYKYLIKSLI